MSSIAHLNIIILIDYCIVMVHECLFIKWLLMFSTMIDSFSSFLVFIYKEISTLIGKKLLVKRSFTCSFLFFLSFFWSSFWFSVMYLKHIEDRKFVAL